MSSAQAVSAFCMAGRSLSIRACGYFLDRSRLRHYATLFAMATLAGARLRCKTDANPSRKPGRIGHPTRRTNLEYGPMIRGRTMLQRAYLGLAIFASVMTGC